MLQAPFGWPAYLVFILFVPFLDLNASLSFSRRFLNGFLFGLGYFAVHLKWLAVVGTDAWLSLAVICAVWWGISSSLAGYYASSKFWPFWFASSWSALEILRDHFPWGGFGWGQVGLIWIDTPFAGLYATFGQIGVTWLTYFLVAVLYIYIVRDLFAGTKLKIKRVGIGLVGALAVSFFSANFQPVYSVSSDSITILGIQGGVEHYGMGTGSDPYAVVDRHIKQTIENLEVVNNSDIVVWPESSVDQDPTDDDLTFKKLIDLDKKVAIPVLVGTTIYDQQSLKSNSAQLLYSGKLQTVYEKRHLVPFGEFLPLRYWIEQYTDRASLLAHDFKPGKTSSRLTIKGHELMVLICFEVADESLALENIEQKSAIIIPTNNATYQNLGQTQQQAIYSRLRAIETGRKVISIATSGESVIVNQYGQIESSLSQDDVGILTTDVSKTTGFTLASKLFYPIEILIFCIFILGLIQSLKKSRIES